MILDSTLEIVLFSLFVGVAILIYVWAVWRAHPFMITVPNTKHFRAGDEIRIRTDEGWEFLTIIKINGNELLVERVSLFKTFKRKYL